MTSEYTKNNPKKAPKDKRSITPPDPPLNPPEEFLARMDWYERIAIAVEAKKQGKKARAGKPSVFSYPRIIGRG